jgi:eukaryotic-like serine/threonine-protein kinase
VPDTLPARVRFGGFDFDLRTGELFGGEQTVRLSEKPCRVLAILLEHEGDLVTRDELQQKLWPNDTIVDFEHSINTAIKRLRQALGDSAEHPKYIETIPRHGYRLMVPVERIVAGDSLHSAIEEVQSKVALPTAQAQADSLIGKKVSHYRVLEVIGGGGMGMIYRAEDLKLGREVALKFLPEELAWDGVALERFQREARTASSLDHPNICTIYDVQEHDEQPFIVMQLLHGETLRDRLACDAAIQKRIALNELLEIAIQTCEGLRAAHEQGIIHRDIKPANIFLTSHGQVKILDFGLAKLVSAAKEIGSDGVELATDGVAAAPQPARTAPADATLTRLGAAMGTAGYMSPEQVRGEQVDARSDLFSFGLVLYEMATGQRTFPGETVAAVHDAILNATPIPVRELNSDIPPKLESIIGRALEKDREQRYQSAAEMAVDLRHLREQKFTSPVRRISTSPRLWLAGSLVVVLCVVGIFYVRSRWWPVKPVAKELVVRPLTSNWPDNPVLQAAISPDGKRLAYWDRAKGITILQIDTGESRILPNTRSFSPGAWIDDDHLLAYNQPKVNIWKLSIVNGALHKIRDDDMGLLPSPDGNRLLGLDDEGGVWLLDTEGADAHRVAVAGDDHAINGFSWSPSGQRFVYQQMDAPHSPLPNQGSSQMCHLKTCDFAGHCSTILSDPRLGSTTGYSPIDWLADGRIVFSLVEPAGRSSDTNLWSLQVDPNSGDVIGEPKRLTNWTSFSPAYMSSSRDGKRLVFASVRSEDTAKLAQLRTGSEVSSTRVLNSENWLSLPVGWAADSQTALLVADRYGKQTIFTQSVAGGAPQILVSGHDSYYAPVLTPDQKFLFYTAQMEDGAERLMRMPFPQGTPAMVMAGSYSYDCASLPATLCVVSELSGNQLVFSTLDPFTGRGQRLAAVQVPVAHYYTWSLSPDGKSIALLVVGDVENGVQLLSTEGQRARTVHVSRWSPIRYVHWTSDGQHFYISGYGAGENIYQWAIARLDLTGRFKVLLRTPADIGYLGDPIPSPDGRYLLYKEKKLESNIVMLENF